MRNLKHAKPSFGVFLYLNSLNERNWQKEIKRVRMTKGIQHIELLLEYFNFTRTQLIKIKRLLQPYELIIHAPYSTYSLVTDRKGIAQATLYDYFRVIKIAKYLNATVMTIHGGGYPDYNEEKNIERRFLAHYRQLKKRSGSLVISLENPPEKHGGTKNSFSTIEALSSVATRTPSLGITIDVGHLIKDGKSVRKSLEAVRSRITNIHLHDGIPGDKEHLPLGTGALNLDEFFSALRKIHYAGYVSLEVYPPEKHSWKIVQQYKAKYYH